MNIFDQYGIKEVADVTLYSIHKKTDGSGDVYYVPALYLDTLKISSVEKTAENVWAQGGLGNARLICWDYGKQINVSLEDALCTPASLGMCWGGILSADWKDGKIDHKYGISHNGYNKVEKISRMEKAFYPKNNRDESSISYLLPQTKDERKYSKNGVLLTSSIVDGTEVRGFGYVNNKTYSWRMVIETDQKSIYILPDKFFDINGNSYKIKDKVTIGVNCPESISLDSNDTKETITFKYSVIYSLEETQENNANPSNQDGTADTLEIRSETIIHEIASSNIEELAKAKFLRILVDNDNNYYAQIPSEADSDTIPKTSTEWKTTSLINTKQFKDIDMWLKFDSVNEMIYFILTKYENDIISLNTKTYERGENVEDAIGVEYKEKPGDKPCDQLWAYINPKTMEPYPDDYWFSQGEPYYIKSITFANNKELKAKRITVTAGQFPGMYMMVGETYIRNRDTGEDERMQIKFPLCKVLSEQGLTLEAEGDPTVFNLNLEVARPVNGIMMELTSYEVSSRKLVDENGEIRIEDGSTKVETE